MTRILIPLDGSQLAERAIPHAVAIAGTFTSEIELLGIVDRIQAGSVNSVDWHLSKVQTEIYLSRVAEALDEKGITASWYLREGEAAQAIIQHLQSSKADLLVMARYGAGDARSFPMGGTAQKVISAAATSILLIDPLQPFDDERGYASILVAVDGSQCSEWAVGFSAMIAQAYDGSINILRVVEEPTLPKGTPVTAETRRYLEHIKRIAGLHANLQLINMTSKIPSNVGKSSSVVSSYNIPKTISETARRVGADLLVVSAEDAHSDGRGRYGSVCDALLLRARFPVLILRAEAARLSASHFRSVYLDETESRAGAH